MLFGRLTGAEDTGPGIENVALRGESTDTAGCDSMVVSKPLVPSVTGMLRRDRFLPTGSSRRPTADVFAVMSTISRSSIVFEPLITGDMSPSVSFSSIRFGVDLNFAFCAALRFPLRLGCHLRARVSLKLEIPLEPLNVPDSSDLSA